MSTPVVSGGVLAEGALALGQWGIFRPLLQPSAQLLWSNGDQLAPNKHPELP